VIPTDNATVLDRVQLRDVTLDDPDLMREVVTDLIDDTTRQMKLLDAAIQAGDPKETARLAHYAKGVCANLGANTLAILLKRIETRAATSDFEDCRSSLFALGRELDLLRQESAKL
jgi:HPt (histidine-containing phosphotransfer) domain-containing protein